MQKIYRWIVSAIVVIFGGYALYEKKRADSKAEENEELEEQIHQSEYNHSVDTANELIKAKEQANAKIQVPTTDYSPADF